MKKILFLTIILIFQTSLFGKLNLIKQWQFNTKDSIKASPLIKENYAYISSYDGNLYKLNIENKKEVWHFQTQHLISSSAILDKDRLFIGSGDNYFMRLMLKKELNYGDIK